MAQYSAFSHSLLESLDKYIPLTLDCASNRNLLTHFTAQSLAVSSEAFARIMQILESTDPLQRLELLAQLTKVRQEHT